MRRRKKTSPIKALRFEFSITNTRQLLKTRDSAMYTALLIALAALMLAGGAWVLRRRETDSK